MFDGAQFVICRFYDQYKNNNINLVLHKNLIDAIKKFPWLDFSVLVEEIKSIIPEQQSSLTSREPINYFLYDVRLANAQIKFKLAKVDNPEFSPSISPNLCRISLEKLLSSEAVFIERGTEIFTLDISKEEITKENLMKLLLPSHHNKQEKHKETDRWLYDKVCQQIKFKDQTTILEQNFAPKILGKGEFSNYLEENLKTERTSNNKNKIAAKLRLITDQLLEAKTLLQRCDTVIEEFRSLPEPTDAMRQSDEAKAREVIVKYESLLAAKEDIVKRRETLQTLITLCDEQQQGFDRELEKLANNQQYINEQYNQYLIDIYSCVDKVTEQIRSLLIKAGINDFSSNAQLATVLARVKTAYENPQEKIKLQKIFQGEVDSPINFEDGELIPGYLSRKIQELETKYWQQIDIKSREIKRKLGNLKTISSANHDDLQKEFAPYKKDRTLNKNLQLLEDISAIDKYKAEHESVTNELKDYISCLEIVAKSVSRRLIGGSRVSTYSRKSSYHDEENNQNPDDETQALEAIRKFLEEEKSHFKSIKFFKSGLNNKKDITSALLNQLPADGNYEFPTFKNLKNEDKINELLTQCAILARTKRYKKSNKLASNLTCGFLYSKTASEKLWLKMQLPDKYKEKFNELSYCKPEALKLNESEQGKQILKALASSLRKL